MGICQIQGEQERQSYTCCTSSFYLLFLAFYCLHRAQNYETGTLSGWFDSKPPKSLKTPYTSICYSTSAISCPDVAISHRHCRYLCLAATHHTHSTLGTHRAINIFCPPFSWNLTGDLQTLKYRTSKLVSKPLACTDDHAENPTLFPI